MKKMRHILLALAMVLCVSVPASAKLFSIGPRLGVAVNDLKFSSDVFDGENRAGFTGGVQLEVTAPLGIGFDASVMYVRRDARFFTETANGESDVTNMSKDWIEIPINFKYKIGLPVVGKIVTPYLFTGPSFSFLTSSRAISEAWKSNKFDVSWNIGAGVQLFSHLQVGASYGFGMTKLAKYVVDAQGGNVNGKNRYWTITAAWLF